MLHAPCSVFILVATLLISKRGPYKITSAHFGIFQGRIGQQEKVISIVLTTSAIAICTSSCGITMLLVYKWPLDSPYHFSPLCSSFFILCHTSFFPFLCSNTARIAKSPFPYPKVQLHKLRMSFGLLGRKHRPLPTLSQLPNSHTLRFRQDGTFQITVFSDLHFAEGKLINSTFHRTASNSKPLHQMKAVL